MKSELFCIAHGEMEHVEYGEITGLPLHLVYAGTPKEPDVDWCEGPFASCPPPEIGEDYWEAVFASEDACNG